MTKAKRTKAFTLVEVITVIVIIVLIAAFGFPNYKKMVRKTHERNAVMHLTTIHGGNEIYKARGTGAYLPGAGLNSAQINAGLSININHDEMTYSYTRSDPATYTATASWTRGNNFTVRINQSTVSPGTNNPCCSAGTCPSLPACT